MAEVEFREWPKISRWNRDITITEKVDGSNACVIVSEDLLTVAAQSRSKIITPETDNHGFARWVAENEEMLATTLGAGYHFGEWYGSGVQKRAGYGLEKGVKKLALFNTARWMPTMEAHPYLYDAGLDVVPVLWEGKAETLNSGIAFATARLREEGSFVRSARGVRDVKPEGIIIYHHAANMSFKLTLEKDEEWKGRQQ